MSDSTAHNEHTGDNETPITDLVSQTSSMLDSLRHVDEQGEHWFARELMSPLGYAKWQRFDDAVDRAITALKVNGDDHINHITTVGKMINVGNGATRAVTDYRLTRYGAFAVIQGADPRKPEIASAWAYFRVKTREAEVFDEVLETRGVIVKPDWITRTQHLTSSDALDEKRRDIELITRVFDIVRDTLPEDERHEVASYVMKLSIGMTKARADIERKITTNDNIISITAYLTERGVSRPQRVRWVGMFGTRVHQLYREEYGREAPVGQKIMGGASRAGKLYVEKDRFILDRAFDEFIAAGKFAVK